MLDVVDGGQSEDHFQETAWSVVLTAGAKTPARAHAAMAELCRIYWRPIYTYLRRTGYSVHDAQDMTQSFFQHLLENETLQRASRERGRFRSFLLGVLKVCLADDYAHHHALKRGGAVQFVPIDEFAEEERHYQPRAAGLTPDESLDARWAGVLLERALKKMQLEFDDANDSKTFQNLSPFLAGEKPEASYDETARKLGISLGALKSQVHRLRQRFGAAVRFEIMQTVAAPHEVQNELRHLRDVFARVAAEGAC